MKSSNRIIAGLVLASFLVAAPAAAQESGSTQIGNATVTVGGGTALLTLPDVPSLIYGGTAVGLNAPITQAFKASKDFEDEIGWNINGAITVSTGANQTVSLSGFWANIDQAQSSACTAASGTVYCLVGPIVDDPAATQTAGFVGGPPFTITGRAERDVDMWGVSLESKWQQAPGVMGVTRAPHRSYLALGADIRGIDQDFREIFSGSLGRVIGRYDEDLDTRYYGVYAAWGRDYKLPFFSGISGNLGLQSSFLLRGGIYYADTDYKGVSSATAQSATTNASGALSLSRDDAAFIGGLVLETKKPIGKRALLSLKSEYEYYSYVPEMAYNQRDVVAGGTIAPNGQIGTRIGSDDALSARTTLRLIIGLGPSEFYQ